MTLFKSSCQTGLPRSKSWLSLTWQIPECRNRIAVTMLEAAEKVDSGVIYVKEWLEFEDDVLASELRREQAGSIVGLYKKFADEYSQILEQAFEQVGDESFYTRRDETDCELGPM